MKFDDFKRSVFWNVVVEDVKRKKAEREAKKKEKGNIRGFLNVVIASYNLGGRRDQNSTILEPHGEETLKSDSFIRKFDFKSSHS
jgi:hypothetical protein